MSVGPRALWASLRAEGVGATWRQVRTRLFGSETYYVMLRRLEPPPASVELPCAIAGATVRAMTAADVDAVAARVPFRMSRLPQRERCAAIARCLDDAVVAVRDGRVVGAAWYGDQFDAGQPWFAVVEPHAPRPVRIGLGFFVVAGEQVAAWQLARVATDRLAARGVRTLVVPIRSDNKPSMLMSRLNGARMVARCVVRYRWGRRTVRAEAVGDGPAFAPQLQT